MKKKILALFCAAAMLLASGCSGNESANSAQTSATTSATSSAVSESITAEELRESDLEEMPYSTLEIRMMEE